MTSRLANRSEVYGEYIKKTDCQSGDGYFSLCQPLIIASAARPVLPVCRHLAPCWALSGRKWDTVSQFGATRPI